MIIAIFRKTVNFMQIPPTLLPVRAIQPGKTLSDRFMLKYTDMRSYAFGIDIGGTAVKLGFFNGQGELIERWQIPTRLQDHGAYILSDIAASAENFLTARSMTWDDVNGIGVAVPGPVLNGAFVPLAVNLSWKNYDVKEEMRKLTGISAVHIENDAKAAALGEYWKGGWEAYHSAVMITLGTAVGGAVILDGKPVSGAFGAAGELSHIQVKADETEPCACGKYGHLQQYVSTEAIIRNYSKKTGGRERTVKEIFDAAQAGDKPALETVDEAVRMLGRAMATVSCVIDPELYLIGGGISKAGDFLLDKLRTEFRKLALAVSENARIEAAKTGSDAGIFGAVRPVICI